MSINLGTAACDAARALGTDPRWVAIRAGIAAVMRQRMHSALELPLVGTASIADGVGYARALRDIAVALDAATTGENPRSVQQGIGFAEPSVPPIAPLKVK